MTITDSPQEPAPQAISPQRSSLDDGKILWLIPEAWRLNLTSAPWVRRIIKSPFFNFAPTLLNLWIFVIIIIGAFVAPQIGNANLGIMFVWILWWVLLMMVMVPFLGRIWCQSCPLPSLGEWMQRKSIVGRTPDKEFLGLKKRWPKALSNMWLVNFIFLGLALFSGILTTRPWATGLLFLSIIVVDLIVAYVFRLRAFCLYLCPVGGFLGLFSNFATVEVRSKDKDICARHVPKECVVGSSTGYGCPWMQLPFSQTRNTYCGMCFECLRSCSYDNMMVQLRPPGTDLLVDEHRGLDEAYKGLIMLSCAILYSVVMMGPWGFIKDGANVLTWKAWAVYAGAFLLWALLVFPGIFWLVSAISRVLSKKAGEAQAPLKRFFVAYSYTLVPLGMMAWIAFSFGILLPNGSYVLSVISDPWNQGWNLFGTAGFAWQPFLTGLTPYLQILVMLGALLFSINIATKIAGQLFPSDSRRAVHSLIPVILFHMTAVAALLALFVG